MRSPASTTGDRRWPLWSGLVGLLWLGFALRVFHLDLFSFWLDEGLTPLRAGYPLRLILRNVILLQEAVSQDTHPPAYFLLVAVTRRLFGESDFAYRFPSVLADMVLLALLWRFGRALMGARGTAANQVGLVAVLFAAVNPLHIWYAQEARMYTLLVLLGAAASYQLWLALRLAAANPKPERARIARHFLFYLLFAVAALLTHYIAVFLFAGQALIWVWVLYRSGARRLIAAGVAVAAVLGLALGPALWPRLFTGAETLYRWLPPRVLLLDIVRGFGFGLTVDYARPLVVGLAAAHVALLVVALAPSADSRRTRHLARALFLTLGVLAVPLGIALISPLKPMYLGVRHIMLGTPAYILLLALATVWLGRWRPLAGGFALGAVVVAGAIALTPLYFNPAFAKDDYRSLVAYVESRAAPGDVVVYNNATSLPLHWHYQTRTDLVVTSYPVYPHHTSIRSYTSLMHLAAAAPRIWYVPLPPQDGRDAIGGVSAWLESQHALMDDRFFHGPNNLMQVTTYRTGDMTPDMVDSAHALPQPVSPGGDLPRLVSADWSADGALTVDLVWQDVAQLPADGVYFTLVAPDGVVWVRHAAPFSPDPTPPAAAGALLRTSYLVPIPPGTPAGSYTLQLNAWHEPTASTRGESLALGTVALPATCTAACAAAALGQGDGGRAGHVTLAVDAAAEVFPGNPLPVTLLWQARQPLTGAWRYSAEAVGRFGRVVAQTEGDLLPAWRDGAAPGELLRVEAGLYFPPDTPPQSTRLRWRVWPADAPGEGATATAGRVTVADWPRVTALPPVDGFIATPAEFGDRASLRGYTLTQAADRLALTLYWQADGPLDDSYFVFVHLSAAPGTPPVAQSDQVPVGNLRPTNGWRQGEILADAHTVLLPPDLPPGTYTLNVGFFRPGDGVRLPVSAGGVPQPDGQLPLVEIDIP